MQSLKLGLKLYQRHAKKGLLTIMLLALMLGIASFTTVSVFSDRLQRAVTTQASELLGGDIIISGTQSIPTTWETKANALGLRTTRALDFLSMLLIADQLQLASVKAVSGSYPLYGKLEISDKPYIEGHPTDNIPEPGTIWLENRLLQALNAKIGDELQLGQATFKITHIITYEPDRSSDFFNISPRAFINQSDIAKTEAVVPGSRVTYHLMMAGNPSQLNEWLSATKSEWDPRYRIQQLNEDRPRIARTLNNTAQYLNLTALVTLILAAVAIAMTAQKYCEEQYRLCALLRCFGAPQRQILQILITIILLVATIGCVGGLIIGYFAQFGLAKLFVDVSQLVLPATSIVPFLISSILGFLLLLGFALPPLLRLKSAPAWQVLRNEPLPLPNMSIFAYLIAAASTTLLIYLLTWDFKLTFFVLGMLAVSFIVFYYFTVYVVSSINSLRNHVSLSWRYAIANIVRHKPQSIFQIIATSLAITVFLLLTVVRNDLYNAWLKEIPNQAPNFFALNIESTDLEKLTEFFNNNGIHSTELYPLIRGQIIALNEKPIDFSAYPDGPPNMLTRALNLTWTNILPPDNQIVRGNWFNSNKEQLTPSLQEAQQGAGISIEKGMADALHLNLGDTITFQIGDQKISSAITSIRTVEWDNFNPNFYVIFPPHMLNNFPATYLTSFYLDPKKDKLILELTKEFPNVSVLDMHQVMEQARGLIEKVASGIQMISSYSYVATLLVLAATLSTSLLIRLYEGAILKTLGANKNQIMKNIFTEYLLAGFISGTLAALMAYLLSYCFSIFLLKIAYEFSFTTAILGAFAGMLMHFVMGVFLYRKVNHTPALTLLRESV